VYSMYVLRSPSTGKIKIKFFAIGGDGNWRRSKNKKQIRFENLMVVYP